MNDKMKDTLDLVKAFEKLNYVVDEGCRIEIRKPSGYTYHVEIINSISGLHKWDIIGCGRTLQEAMDDALFVFDYAADKIKMHGKEWQFKQYPPTQQ